MSEVREIAQMPAGVSVFDMLPVEDVKTIFMHCDFKDPNGLFADEVDINEFAEKIGQVVALRAAKVEREKCVEFVRTLNTHVADALEKIRA